MCLLYKIRNKKKNQMFKDHFESIPHFAWNVTREIKGYFAKWCDQECGSYKFFLFVMYVDYKRNFSDKLYVHEIQRGENTLQNLR